MATPLGPPTPPSPGLPPPGAPPPIGWSPTAPPPTTPLPPRRTPIYIGIAVGVVVVVAILVLALLGILPFFRSAGPSGSSFADTRGPAQSTANGYPGGPWTLVLGGGAALHATTDISKLNTSLPAGPSNCTISQTSAKPPTTVQGVGNVSQGLASAWVFLFRGPSGSMLAVTDFAGNYRVEGTATGTGCAGSVGGYQPVPATVIDSTTAAKAADDAGGYAFLQAHPSANGTIGIIGGVTVFGFTLGAEWLVQYSTCPYVNANPLSDPTFSAIVNATTGTVVQSSSSTMTCPVSSTSGAKTPIGTVLVVGTPAESSVGGHYWYNFTIQSAGGGLNWGSTSFQVQTATGSIVGMPTSSTLGILSITGSLVASYSFAAGAWLTGGSLGVTTQQEISISTPGSLSASGDNLVFIGSGSFTGQLFVSIP